MPDEYCRDKATTVGFGLRYSGLSSLVDGQRRAVIALYVFSREVTRRVEQCRDLAVARAKLHQWRQERDRLYGGRPQHPVGCALAAQLDRFKLL